MFSFFKKKPAEGFGPVVPPNDVPGRPTSPEQVADVEPRSWFERLAGVGGESQQAPLAPAPYESPLPQADVAVGPLAEAETPKARSWFDKIRGTPADTPEDPVEGAVAAPSSSPTEEPEEPEKPRLATGARSWLDKLVGAPGESAGPEPVSVAEPTAESTPTPEPAATSRRGWLDKLRGGLRKTGSSLTQVFTGAQIDDALYEELESALLMADAGIKATEYLLIDLKWRVKDERTNDPAVVKRLLADAIADLLAPLEKALTVGEHVPTVMMVVGVNGAGKTTSIGKLTRHLADANQKVLLAAADTFRAAAREQLAVWAQRAELNPTLRTDSVEIVSQEGGDPAAVTFDAVIAGKARGCDVVIADTAGRLVTQLHLMEELKKIRRVIGKAQEGAPHEVLLVVDGNTGQNALSQVQLFDAALGLTGIIITKLDGTAKGGVLAAIALWSREQVRRGGHRVPVYFIGVGERLEDLQTFDAREFAQALLG